MTRPACPACRKPLERVEPVRLVAVNDALGASHRSHWTRGYACPACGVLLPLTRTPDDPPDNEP
ncbi:hypothetical protein [Phenylobacterium sp.]|uniref:hypothetical protein n=1 Tax=Phenylobacterium sp. TaxID=1871053 RepID=UPI0025DA2205|nr:hypothetical protein [Phenylobacterium sp.]